MSVANESFYFSKVEPAKSCLLALRTIILQNHNSIVETIKYGMPCFCIGKKILCYLWVDKKTGEPYILFIEGKNLDFPELEAGKRTKMKIFRVDPNKDLPVIFIIKFLKAAIELSFKNC